MLVGSSCAAAESLPLETIGVAAAPRTAPLVLDSPDATDVASCDDTALRLRGERGRLAARQHLTCDVGIAASASDGLATAVRLRFQREGVRQAGEFPHLAPHVDEPVVEINLPYERSWNQRTPWHALPLHADRQVVRPARV